MNNLKNGWNSFVDQLKFVKDKIIDGFSWTLSMLLQFAPFVLAFLVLVILALSFLFPINSLSGVTVYFPVAICWLMLFAIVRKLLAVKDMSDALNWSYFWLGTCILSISLHAAIFKSTDLMKDGDCFTPSFQEALYFSIVTWTTLGYGDLQPTADAQLIAALEALLGYTNMALLFGVVAAILSNKIR